MTSQIKFIQTKKLRKVKKIEKRTSMNYLSVAVYIFRKIISNIMM